MAQQDQRRAQFWSRSVACCRWLIATEHLESAQENTAPTNTPFWRWVLAREELPRDEPVEKRSQQGFLSFLFGRERLSAKDRLEGESLAEAAHPEPSDPDSLMESSKQ